MAEAVAGDSSEFAKRFAQIGMLEDELLSKASQLVPEGSSVFLADLFVIRGIKRAPALATGFRQLIESRNFTCAASLLRMQIDTAARLHALTYIEDVNTFGEKTVGHRQFRILQDAESAPDWSWAHPEQ